MEETTIEKRFGELVRTLRLKKRFTQEGFAHHLGIDRSYQGRIERAEVTVTIRMAEVIAKGLGLEISGLMLLLDRARKKESEGHPAGK